MGTCTVDFTVNRKTGFSPEVFPASGAVFQGDWITFLSDEEHGVYFLAATGLFYLRGNHGATNSDTHRFRAPRKHSNHVLRLCIAANPSTVTPFRLKIAPSLDPRPCHAPPDGTINVGTKTQSESMSRRRHSLDLHLAPIVAMPARGLD